MVFIGILFAILATIFYGISPILQKRALCQMEDIEIGKNFFSSLKRMFKNRDWRRGLIIGLLGFIPFLIAVNLVGLSIVMPLMPLCYLIILFGSRKYLNENIDLKGKIGIVLLMIMPLLFFISDVSNPQKGILSDSIQQTSFIFLLICFFILAISLFLLKKYPLVWSLVVGILLSIGNIFFQTGMIYLNSKEIGIIGLITLIFSDFSVIFFDDVILKMFLFLIIGFLIGISGNFLMQIGLQKNNTSVFSPIKQSINILTSIIGGFYIFEQKISNIPFYLIGLICAILGTFLLGKYEEL